MDNVSLQMLSMMYTQSTPNYCFNKLSVYKQLNQLMNIAKYISNHSYSMVSYSMVS